MKRSTLTLSILTALLVSACGGSGSDDQGAKDPDPKPTPTNPTPSNPTPSKPNPGSSVVTPEPEAVNPSPEHGSAPIESGGNQSTGGVYIPPKNDDDGAKDKDKDKDDGAKDKDKDNDGAKDKDKDKDGAKDKDNKDDKDNQSPSSVEQAKNALKASQEKLVQIDQEIVGKKGAFDAQKAQLGTDLDDAKNAAGVTGPTDTIEAVKNKLDELKADPSSDSDEIKKIEKAIAKYEATKAATEKADEELKKSKEAKSEAEKDVSKDKKELALAKAEKDINSDIQSVQDKGKAVKALAEAVYKKEQATAAFTAADNKVQALTGEKDALESENDDLKNNVIADTSPASSERKEAAKAKIKENEERIKQLSKEIVDANSEKTIKEAEQKAAEDEKTAAEGVATKAIEDAKNLGIAGVTGFSDANFVEVQKVVKENDDKWIITFKGEEKPVEIDTTAINQPILNEADKYGNFKDGTAVKVNNGTKESIYGYVGDKFFSVGAVYDEDAINKIIKGEARYEGSAFLKDAKKADVIATFTGTANFSSSKEFTGQFSDFKTFDPKSPTAAGKAHAELKDGVGFAAKIKGNKFMTETASPGKASVYGYFYGEGATPSSVGGLVELKDVFHGSFGGKNTP